MQVFMFTSQFHHFKGFSTTKVEKEALVSQSAVRDSYSLINATVTLPMLLAFTVQRGVRLDEHGVLPGKRLDGGNERHIRWDREGWKRRGSVEWKTCD